MKQLLFLSLYLFCIQATAEQIVLKSPNVSIHEFNAFMMTQPKAKTYVELQKDQLVDLKIKKALSRSFTKAQKSYFTESSDLTIEKFKTVLGFKYLADWGPAERSQILHAHIRIAELTENSTDKTKLLKAAAQFSMGMKLNAKIFSPPTLKEYETIQTQLKARLWDPQANENIYSTALINGRAYPIIEGQPLMLPRGQVRLTLLSNTHQAFSRVLDSENLKELKLSAKPLITGSCNNFNLDPSLLKFDTKIYFNAECIPLGNPNLNRTTPRLVDLKPKVDFKITDPLQSLHLQNKKSFVRKNWKWLTIGAAVIVTGILLSQDKETTPSTKSGF